MIGKDEAKSLEDKFDMAMEDFVFLRERLKYGFGVPHNDAPYNDKVGFVSFYNGYCMAKGRMRRG
jgi:hypothetical protein